MLETLRRWLVRLLVGLLLLVGLCVAGGLLYLRVKGAGVNTPIAAFLADLLPSVFARPRADAAVLATRLRLAEGFSLSVFAQGIPDARMVRTTRAGDLLVTSLSHGQVLLLLRDANGDGAADGARVLLSGLTNPNGLDLHNGFLYVAEEGQVGRVPFDEDRGVVSGAYQVVIPGLPTGGNHYKKTIRFGPDGLLYLAIGSSCNVCLEADAHRASLWRYRADGSGAERVATGLRNSAGFDWRPSDGALFATENGRDMLGDNVPPCELNRIEAGGFYGWPFVNGAGVPDPDYGAGHEADAARARPPVFGFRAHNAPLGIVFPRHGRLHEAYRDTALVALHGSWNRSAKDGYTVVSLHWRADGGIESTDFVSGFLVDDRVVGRPAELAEGIDGSIFISDDFAGAVYRVAYGEGAGVKPGVGFVVHLSATSQPASADAAAAAGAIKAGAPKAGAPKAGAVKAGAVKVGTFEAGARLFREGECLECHGDGETAVPLKGLAGKYDHATLDGYLALPKPPMPPVADAASRAALTAYLLTEFK